MIPHLRAIIKAICVPLLIALLLVLPYVMGAVPHIGVFKLYPILCVILSIILTLLPSQHRQNLRLAFVSAALTICLVDLIWRSPLISPQVAKQMWPPLPVLSRWPANLSLHHTKRGDLATLLGNSRYAEPREVTVITDAYGFRNGDPARIDYITLGDSYTFGSGSSQNESWAALIGRLTDQPVYNLGMGGSSPWQQYVTLAIERSRLHTSADAAVIWMIFAGNDLDDPYIPEWDIDNLRSGLTGFLRAYYLNFRVKSRVGALLTRWVTESDKRVVISHLPDGQSILYFQPQLERAQRSVEQVRQHSNYEPLLTTVRAVKQLTADNGLRLYMVIAPSKEEIYRWAWDSGYESANAAPISAFSKALTQDARQENICVLELAPSFAEEARRRYAEDGSLLWWRDDTHWNVEGNHFAATSILDWLSSEPCQ